MLVQLVGLFVIEGLSLFGVSFFKLKNEYVIPITCMSMGVLLFLFGTAGFLRAGVYVLLALSAASVAISVWICARRGSWHETARNLFTPAAVLFVAAYLIAGVINAGSLPQLRGRILTLGRHRQGYEPLGRLWHQPRVAQSLPELSARNGAVSVFLPSPLSASQRSRWIFRMAAHFFISRLCCRAARAVFVCQRPGDLLFYKTCCHCPFPHRHHSFGAHVFWASGNVLRALH